MSRKIITTFSDHDFEQLALLAKLYRCSMQDLMRKIAQAYLDGTKPRLKEPAE